MDAEDELLADYPTWTLPEMKNLIDNVTTSVHGEKMKKFNSVLTYKRLNWDVLKIEGKSAHDCQNAFKRMTSYMYRTLTVNDLCKMTIAKLQSLRIPLDMVPNAPKKPLTSYCIFSSKYNKSLAKKNPGLSFSETNRLTQEAWNKLSPTKKTKYDRMYQDNKVVFDAAKVEFSKDFKKSKKKATKDSKKGKKVMKDIWELSEITPFDVFWLQSGMSKKHDGRTVFAGFDDEERLKWIWNCVEEIQRRKAAAGNDESDCPIATVNLREGEKRILFRSEGILEKPARTLFAYYRHKYANTDSMENLTKSYQSLDSIASKELFERYIEEMSSYCDRLSSCMIRLKGAVSDEVILDMELNCRAYENLIKKMLTSKYKAGTRQRHAHSTLVKIEAGASPALPNSVSKKRKSSLSDSSSEEIKTPEKKKKLLPESLASRLTLIEMPKKQQSSLAFDSQKLQMSPPSMVQSTILASLQSPSLTESKKKKKKQKIFEAADNETEVILKTGEKKKKKKKKKQSSDSDEE